MREDEKRGGGAVPTRGLEVKRERESFFGFQGIQTFSAKGVSSLSWPTSLTHISF